ncbi:hypothetical protein AAMO2058_000504300 [Amorphochlora amoebiformis]
MDACVEASRWCWFGLFVGSRKPTLVLPNLYIGGITTDRTFYSKNRITHVVSLCGATPPLSVRVNRLHVPFWDCPCSDLGSRTKAVVQFIHQARLTGGSVLVHCMQGVSRSSAMVISYIMASQEMKFQEAFAYLKSKRWRVHPNPGFQEQLRSSFDYRGVSLCLANINASDESRKVVVREDSACIDAWRASLPVKIKRSTPSSSPDIENSRARLINSQQPRGGDEYGAGNDGGKDD